MRLPRCAIASVLLPASSLPTWADPITILSVRRATAAAVTLTDASGTSRQNLFDQQSDMLTTAAVASTLLSSGTAVATLTSTLPDPMHWSGTGTISGSWTVANAADVFLESSYRVSFLVTSPVFYRYDGSFTSSSSNAPGLPFQGGVGGGGGASLRAQRPVPDDPEHGTPIFGGPGPHTGVLIPDVYFFNASASGFLTTVAGGSTGNLQSGFDFTLDLTPADSAPSPTPEPASVMLLGTGIAGICASRARRRQDQGATKKAVPAGQLRI
jgi:PEP-CTERM motif